MAGDDNLFRGILTELRGFIEDYPDQFLIGGMVIIAALIAWAFL